MNENTELTSRTEPESRSLQISPSQEGGALLHNVLPLSLYLELRERFPYLTHSCKSQLNSSNSEKELQTRLFPISAQGSCQDRGSLRDHPLTVDLRASSPLKTAGVPAQLSSRSHLQLGARGVRELRQTRIHENKNN